MQDVTLASETARGLAVDPTPSAGVQPYSGESHANATGLPRYSASGPGISGPGISGQSNGVRTRCFGAAGRSLSSSLAGAADRSDSDGHRAGDRGYGSGWAVGSDRTGSRFGFGFAVCGDWFHPCSVASALKFCVRAGSVRRNLSCPRDPVSARSARLANLPRRSKRFPVLPFLRPVSLYSREAISPIVTEIPATNNPTCQFWVEESTAINDRIRRNRLSRTLHDAPSTAILYGNPV